MTLSNEMLRQCLAATLKRHVPQRDEAERILERAQQGDKLSFSAIADALDISCSELFDDFAREVFFRTGALIRPVAYAQ